MLQRALLLPSLVQGICHAEREVGSYAKLTDKMTIVMQDEAQCSVSMAHRPGSCDLAVQHEELHSTFVACYMQSRG